MIQKSDDGDFTISGLKMGMVHMSIKQKTGNAVKLIGSGVFKVKMLPSPIVWLGGQKSGKIKKMIVQAQLGLACHLEGFDIDLSYKVAGFRVDILRNGTNIYTENISGNKFTTQTSAQFNQLMPGDALIFSDLSFYASDHSKRRLDDIEFQIIP